MTDGENKRAMKRPLEEEIIIAQIDEWDRLHMPYSQKLATLGRFIVALALVEMKKHPAHMQRIKATERQLVHAALCQVSGMAEIYLRCEEKKSADGK